MYKVTLPNSAAVVGQDHRAPPAESQDSAQQDEVQLIQTAVQNRVDLTQLAFNVRAAIRIAPAEALRAE